MSHFGVLSYRGAGHLNPLISLARRLAAREHRVTFFQQPELEQRIRQQGMEFFPVGAHGLSGPMHSQENTLRRRACLGGIRHKLNRTIREMTAFLQEYPAAIRAVGVDTLLIGEISLAGPTVAEMLGLPYFIISTSIPHNFGWEAPRSITPSRSCFDRLERELLEVSVLRMRGPIRRSLDHYRKQVGLGSIRRIDTTYPALAHITQWPQCLDMPRSRLPAGFFYTGPFVDRAGRASLEFPWGELDGRPLIYASLGTTRRADPAIFHRIAEACSGLDLQLVMSLGGRRDPAMFTGLPGNPLVVNNAPQLELLRRADIVITHAGPNTVLEALLEGKPMLALPIALDQPAVAARLASLGVAEVLSTTNRSAQQIRAALLNLQNNSKYRDAARKLQTQVCSFSGLSRAADIIEEALTNGARLPQHARLDYFPLTSR